MIFELPSECIFPNPAYAEPDGLLAVGGDLSPCRLIEAYANGIFPWFSNEDPYLWWSPDPRMVLLPEQFKCSKSLSRMIRSGKFEIKIDAHFERVMRSCAEITRKDQDGTWITEEMIEAYTQLHLSGIAHSFEAYYQNVLVGGLYGISLGKAFFGESMFATMRDASKVCFAHLVSFALEHEFLFIDAQQETAHLAFLGAAPITRKDFLLLLEKSNAYETLTGTWVL